MKMPKVAVLVPCYNCSDYLQESLESLTEQSYEHLQFICVDDASTDDTYAILQSFRDRDPRICLIRNDKNQGIAKTLNIAISKVSVDCKYIARFDADDICAATRFERQVSFMESNPDVDVCGSWMQQFGERNESMHYPVEHSEIVKRMIVDNPIGHPAVIMRSSLILDQNIRYDPGWATEDYELWVRLYIRYNAKFHNIPEFLVNYRAHASQYTMATKFDYTREKVELKTTLIRKHPLRYHKYLRKILFSTPRWLVDLKGLKKYFRAQIKTNRFKDLYRKKYNAYLSEKAIYQDCNESNFKVGMGVTVSEGNYITLYDDHNSKIKSILEVGDRTYFGQYNNIRAAGSIIKIGSNCLIAQFVTIVGSNHGINKSELIVEQEYDQSKLGVVIEDDVWIGANSTVLPGARIGQGVVVGAGSVVKGVLEPYGIYAGVPAKLLKYRV